jgi:hypothetical protein
VGPRGIEPRSRGLKDRCSVPAGVHSNVLPAVTAAWRSAGPTRRRPAERSRHAGGCAQANDLC